MSDLEGLGSVIICQEFDLVGKLQNLFVRQSGRGRVQVNGGVVFVEYLAKVGVDLLRQADNPQGSQSLLADPPGSPLKPHHHRSQLCF